jgi:hypothetical protein
MPQLTCQSRTVSKSGNLHRSEIGAKCYSGLACPWVERPADAERRSAVPAQTAVVELTAVDENLRPNDLKTPPNDFDLNCYYQLPNRFDTERVSGCKFRGNRHSPTREQEYRSNERSPGNGEEMGLSGFFL